jgi:serine/threonine-protein kinase
MALHPGDILLNGQYRISHQVAQGGFGFVYLAHDTLLGEQVAIKELIPTLVGDKATLKRFLAEAKATMHLTHERIVRTHNVFRENGNYYIAMEYMPGGSLETRLQQRGPLPVRESIRIAVEVCEGLRYAHEQGVVHCDLKPANILFSADGSAKVADFGIAYVSEQLLTRTWQTSAGFVAGTLPYMSPEQVDGVRDNPRVDVFALGAVLYRMLTGQLYLEFDQRETPGAQADNVLRIRSQPIAPPSTHNRRVPGWLDGAVLKALSKNADDRFGDVVELRAALLHQKVAVPASSPLQPKPAPRGARSLPKLPHRRRTLLIGVALTAALLLIIVTIAVLILSGAGSANETSFVTVVVTPQQVPSPSPTFAAPSPTPSATAEMPTPTPSPYLYKDDFANPDSGWDAYEEEDAWAGYVNGEYRLGVYRADYVTWGNPDLQTPLADFEVDVDARQVMGPLDNNFGLLVRYQPEEQDFYWFQISSDGYYSVDMLRDGEFVPLVSWKESDAIRQGTDVTNHLKVICSGNQYQFYVNDTHLVAITDNTLSLGSIGLAVGAFDEPGVVVHFDNMTVRILQE